MVDSFAALVPIVPGGVGAYLKAKRCSQAFSKARLITTTADLAQGMGAAAQAHIEGNNGEAALYAGMAALGGAGLFRKNPCNCLVAGTPIAIAEGTKPIEEIAVGDEVWAQNPENGQLELSRVVQLFQKEAAGVLILSLDVGGTKENLEVTPEHPIFILDRGWVNAGELEIGDFLLGRDGQPVALESIDWREGLVQVYNFEVEGLHSYFAGHVEVLQSRNCILTVALRRGRRSETLLEEPLLQCCTLWNARIHRSEYGSNEKGPGGKRF